MTTHDSPEQKEVVKSLEAGGAGNDASTERPRERNDSPYRLSQEPIRRIVANTFRLTYFSAVSNLTHPKYCINP